MCAFNNIKLKYRQVVKYTTNFIRCKGVIIDYMFQPFLYEAIIRCSRRDDGLTKEGPKHVVYYYSFTSNKVCCVFDYLPIFQLDISSF